MTIIEFKTRISDKHVVCGPYVYLYDHNKTLALCIFYELDDTEFDKDVLINSLVNFYAQDDFRKLNGLMNFTTESQINEISTAILNHHTPIVTNWLETTLDLTPDTYINNGYVFTFLPHKL